MKTPPTFKRTFWHRFLNWFHRKTGRIVRSLAVDGDAWIICDYDTKTGVMFVVDQGTNPNMQHSNTGHCRRAS